MTSSVARMQFLSYIEVSRRRMTSVVFLTTWVHCRTYGSRIWSTNAEMSSVGPSVPETIGLRP